MNKQPVEHPIPIITLWGHLIVSLQGDLSDTQTSRLADDVLGRLSSGDAHAVVIDASGLWLIDSHLCAALGRIALAATMMGARSMLCGMRPEVVMTLQDMGFYFPGGHTAVSLEAALEEIGMKPPPPPEEAHEEA